MSIKHWKFSYDPKNSVRVQACRPLTARRVADAAFLGAGTSCWRSQGEQLPPHFLFIIKIKEIQSQDKNIIEPWTEKIQKFWPIKEKFRLLLFEFWFVCFIHRVPLYSQAGLELTEISHVLGLKAWAIWPKIKIIFTLLGKSFFYVVFLFFMRSL